MIIISQISTIQISVSTFSACSIIKLWKIACIGLATVPRDKAGISSCVCRNPTVASLLLGVFSGCVLPPRDPPPSHCVSCNDGLFRTPSERNLITIHKSAELCFTFGKSIINDFRPCIATTRPLTIRCIFFYYWRIGCTCRINDSILYTYKYTTINDILKME